MNLEEKLKDALIGKITEVRNALSDEAKRHISTKRDIDNYQDLIKSRFFSECSDEEDYDLLELLKVLLQCYLDL